MNTRAPSPGGSLCAGTKLSRSRSSALSSATSMQLSRLANQARGLWNFGARHERPGQARDARSIVHLQLFGVDGRHGPDEKLNACTCGTSIYCEEHLALIRNGCNHCLGIGVQHLLVKANLKLDGMQGGRRLVLEAG